MLRPLFVLVAGLVAMTTANVSDDCMACMCWASSDGCIMPDPLCNKDMACGPWRITEPYWKDGGYHMGFFQTCAADWTCSEDTVHGYLNRYVMDPSATCETYARTHYGGPSGPYSDFTLEYWYQVKACMDYGIFTPPPIEKESEEESVEEE